MCVCDVPNGAHSRLRSFSCARSRLRATHRQDTARTHTSHSAQSNRRAFGPIPTTCKGHSRPAQPLPFLPPPLIDPDGPVAAARGGRDGGGGAGGDASRDTASCVGGMGAPGTRASASAIVGQRRWWRCRLHRGGGDQLRLTHGTADAHHLTRRRFLAAPSSSISSSSLGCSAEDVGRHRRGHRRLSRRLMRHDKG